MSAAISPDGTRAATVSEDGSLRVWKLDVRYTLKVGAVQYSLPSTLKRKSYTALRGPRIQIREWSEVGLGPWGGGVS
jgi:WD40 repeat protein